MMTTNRSQWSLLALACLGLFATTTTTTTTTNAFSTTIRSIAQTTHLRSLAQLIDEPLAWNTVIGEADRAFQRGSQLDKSGQPRLASDAFHEAATLFQCFLELPENFGHVTNLKNEECQAVLAYTLVRLGFISVEALSDANAAVRLYSMAAEIDPLPSPESFKGIGTSLEATGGNGKDLEHLKQAVKNYRKALARANKASIMFCMGVALERLGETQEAEELLETIQRSEAPVSCLNDSWSYVRWHTRNTDPVLLNLHRGTRDMLKLALDAAMPLIENQRENRAHGLVGEFGVGSGKSMRMTQEILPLDIEMHGFDTFTGLPHAWGSEPAGAYSTGGVVPSIASNVYFHKGLFSDTLSPFLDSLGDEAYFAYANIDCDLYTSTLDILEALHGRIVEGTILVFDEYICHPTWRQDEFRAWRESCKRFGWTYEYLGFSLSSKQAVVRITGV
mmetsp:Transcript_11190/g.28347  ORF Transcript_11190/g.28347 Transcript_11190/m.28347 type:complete len:448 (+) Transcript_11190:127-1470(+)